MIAARVINNAHLAPCHLGLVPPFRKAYRQPVDNGCLLRPISGRRLEVACEGRTDWGG